MPKRTALKPQALRFAMSYAATGSLNMREKHRKSSNERLEIAIETKISREFKRFETRRATLSSAFKELKASKLPVEGCQGKLFCTTLTPWKICCRPSALRQ